MEMTIKEITEATLVEVSKAVGDKLSPQEMKMLEKSIEKGIIQSALRMSDNCQRFTVRHTGPEADIAHKITEDIDRRREALLANLSGLR